MRQPTGFAFALGAVVLAGVAPASAEEGAENGKNAEQAESAEQVVNVYSARHYDTDLALYDRFLETTGVRVRLIEGGSDALIERMANEAEFSPADVLITVDAGRLWRARQRGVLQAVQSSVLSDRIPAHLRDADGYWFGLSKRARVIVYNKAAGLPEGVERYQDLAAEALRGQVCMRSSGNIYNVSLLASLIAHDGEAAAEAWASGVVANFRRPPQGNDTAQLRAVAAGECGVSIANTYYLGRLLGAEAEADRAVAAAIGVLFPNQAGRGAHVNISGAGVARHAPHRDNAVRFLEYLTGDFAQRLFAEGNNEYPVVGPATGPIATLGAFREDTLPATMLGNHQASAVKVFDRAGWK